MVDERGTVFVEYLLLIFFFALPASILTLRLGAPLVELHRYGELVLAGPIP